ncbi:chemotaxis protein CheW [Blastochloris viridis]|uniref:Chemotaxis protein CheW n=1 Tax=Blastochloris viridis TaxID=1079 RepID=A0A0H5B8B2_BLAVI|nr:chemotaxis protein CheW [Blastochloris viridis]ALK08304.1 Chemotaxis protein CheW [Blastochloris viridis]BAR98427.1 positive regulator of CheA protein activity, CheW [Blastochloris viridis]CUU44226.1 Chemotaxis protein CheW [Blastochloris viridis]
MAQPLSAHEAQFVTLGIDREVFAVPVEAVLEILDMQPVFRVPEAPAHMLGLIDLRGRSVPVLDLRTKLGLPRIPPTESMRILVLEVVAGGRLLVLGLVADRVVEVIALGEDEIEAAPDIGVSWRSDYIRGVGRRNGQFVIIFNLARLFADEDAGFAVAAERAVA